MTSPSSTGLALFRNRDFRLFGAARFLTSLASEMQVVAVGWFVYDLTRSPFALGLTGLAAFLPAILAAPISGHVADSHDRRLIAAGAWSLATLAQVGLFAFALLGGHSVWPIYALVVVMGIGRAFASPALSALLPTLVPREHFGTAVVWVSSFWQSAAVIGPALGGVLYVLGPTTVFGVSAAIYALGSLLVAAIRFRPEKPAARGAITWASLSAGLSYIRAQPVVLGAISLDLVAVLLGGATALLPIFAAEILHVGPLGLGALRSMPAVGAVAVAIWLAYRPLTRRAGPKLLMAVALFGLATVVFGLSHDFWLSMASLLVAGAADMVSVYVRQSVVQGETPDAMRGRVSAVESVFIGASNQLGEFESGTLAALVGAAPAVVAGGLATLLVAMVWGRLFPALKARDRLMV
ncbi:MULTISPECIES: MFS transporter [Methylobacterium]|uniref:Enterobactin exporter EntS n=1 Tax=Methylobacterium thuringiense TaxID=1003091 RepID=A0ABQ4TKA3_9HYPH|nr:MULTISPECIES: MFS transporter [Methylobacterium]TXN24571.1 MFS transporter [Methylobacterium sp. WL9]GJE55038.1 Enterobactin exporter EntS [Methylobacterium thuringiense]